MLLPDITAKDICQPIDSYPVIYEDDTVQRALSKLQFALCNSAHKRRNLLVLDRNDQHVGLITLWDILALLQPNKFTEHHVDNLNYIKGWNISTYANSSSYFIQQLMWWVSDEVWPSLEKHCEGIADIKVKKLARSLHSSAVEGNFCLKEVATVMHKNNLFTLPVMENGKFIGVIRSEDIILEAARIMMAKTIANKKVGKDQLLMPLAHSP